MQVELIEVWQKDWLKRVVRWNAVSQKMYLPEEQRCSEGLRLAGCRGVHNGDGFHVALYEGILTLFKIYQAILLKQGLAAEVS